METGGATSPLVVISGTELAAVFTPPPQLQRKSGPTSLEGFLHPSGPQWSSGSGSPEGFTAVTFVDLLVCVCCRTMNAASSDVLGFCGDLYAAASPKKASSCCFLSGSPAVGGERRAAVLSINLLS